MSISQEVIERLEELKIQDRASEVALVKIPLEEQGLSVTLALQDYDRYSAVLQYIEVGYTGTSIDQVEAEEYLRHCAEQLANRLTYLEEPLALVELDTEEGVAQVRSLPPRQNGATITYWEAQVLGKPLTRVRLTRYQWTPNAQERRPVVYPATFATLGRLAEDLAVSLVE